MADIALLASRYASRPLLLTADAAQDLALRIRTIDARAFERPSRVDALLRRIGLANGGQAARTPFAMDDADGDGAVAEIPLHEQLAYSPRWIGDVEDTGFCWSLKDGVALMCCDTPLVERGDEFCGMVWHGYDTLLMGMREALADARVRGLFLVLDTPGGVAGSGLPELAAFMRAARESAGGKPIWIYARMACSAGYWIAASGDRVLAGQFAYVGSLGAVVGHENLSGAFAKAGIEFTTVEFPEHGLKTEGGRWKALSEAGRAAWQSDINQLGETFFADVEAGRSQLKHDAMMSMRAEAFMAEHSDPARSGLALGLVDEIATEEEAFALLVAHVSAPADETPEPTEGRMAKKPTTGGKAPAAQVAQAEKALRAAQANLAKAKVEAQTAQAADEGDEEDEDEDAATETPPADDPEDDNIDPADDEDEEGDTPAAASAAKAISGSAEAKSHPHLAHAAIASGQSLKQFQASVAALGSTPGASRLDRVMSGSRRLGPDASKAGKSTVAGAVAARIAANRGVKAEA